MGKIRVRVLGDDTQEKQQKEAAKKRREEKKLQKEKTHVKGVGLKGGQQIKMMEGVELTPEIESVVEAAESGSVKSESKPKTKPIIVRLRSKRYKNLLSRVDRKKLYPLTDATKLVKQTATTTFDGSVDAHINLVKTLFTKDKKSLSGSVNLPHGTGKKRVIKICDDSVLSDIEAGKINFDVLISTPQMMPRLAKFAKVLGPKGLMPNPKSGTITSDPEKRAKELEGGELNWKTEPDQPVIHQTVGKVSFADKQLEENLSALINSIGTSKIAKLTLASSMGPGVKVDPASA